MIGNAVLKSTVDFESCTCSACGIVYFVPDNFRDKRRQDHKTFYCPNGHNQYFPGETEAERLTRELAAEKQRTRLALARENEERIAREKLARKLKRVGRGVCPECNRSFANLARHMNCKHGGTDGKFGKPKLP